MRFIRWLLFVVVMVLPLLSAQAQHRKPNIIFIMVDDLGEESNVAAKYGDLVGQMTKLMDDSYTPSPKWKFPAPKRKAK